MGSRASALTLSLLMLFGTLVAPALADGDWPETGERDHPPEEGSASVIDLLVIYPEPETGSTHIDDLSDVYGVTTVDGYLSSLFEHVNGNYNRSGVGAEFSLLPSMQVNMSNLDDDWKARLSSALMNPELSYNADYIAELNAIRNSTHADVILYWRQSGDGGPGAPGASAVPAEENEAYVQITHSRMTPYIVSHELGHLMGGEHLVGIQIAANVSVDGGDFQEYEVRSLMTSQVSGLDKDLDLIRLWAFSDANATVNGEFPCSDDLEPSICIFAEETPLGNASRSNVDLMRLRASIMAGFRTQLNAFSEFAAAVSDLHEQWLINGSQVAIAYNGSIVFQGAYGMADEESGAPINESSRFRIASLSKAITSAAIFTLNRSNAISLEDRMVDLIPHLLPETIEDCAYPTHSNGYSIVDITVYDLLHHRGGWNRDVSGDPTYYHWNTWEGTGNPCIDSDGLVTDYDGGNLAPIPMEKVVEEWLRTPLDFEPGGQREYSNIGYQILGQIIETVSGTSYENYTQQNVLAPMGITNMEIGRTILEERARDEVRYYDYQEDTSPCAFPSGQDAGGDPIFPYAPDPYCGAFVVEEKDSGGGWIATASDYALFLAHIDGTLETSEFNGSFEYFVDSPETSSSSYGSGIFFNSYDVDEWTHTGSFSGTSTWFKRDTTDSGGSVIVVMFSNTKPSPYSTWNNHRKSTLTSAMLAVDYSQAAPLDSEEEGNVSFPVTIDGLFDDWESIPVVYADPAGDGTDEDFSMLKIANDNDFMFFSIEFHDGEHLMQNWNDIHLYLDTDAEVNTGLPVHGIGAELDWCFGCRSGYYYIMDGIIEISQNDLTLRIAPTITGERFEIAISRSSAILTMDGTQEPTTIKIVLQGGGEAPDILPDEPGGIEYEFDSTPVPSPEIITLEKNEMEHLRILSYNVRQNGLFDSGRQARFERIIKALEPDIMGFQEAYDDNDTNDVNDIEALFEDWFPEVNWHVSSEWNGNFVVSRYPILHQGNHSWRSMGVLLDTEEDLGTPLFFINSHFSCCDANDNRQEQVDELMGFVRDLKNGLGPFTLEYGTPIVHVGDFNLVGYRQQLTTLTDGDIVDEVSYGIDFLPDWDDSPLTDLFSRQTHIRMGYTWRKDNSEWNPGKLDYILYTDSVLEPVKHFVLNTLAMSEEDLSFYNLNSEDTEKASDHLPRVMDIAEDPEEPTWVWPDPLPPQDDDIMGDAHLDITGTIASSSNITATWYANVSIRDDYGTGLPD